MPVETGTTIAQLDSLWPLNGDFILEGDNHLRLIKAILKAQFPGALGQGLDIPIVATEVEMNYLSGLTDNIQDQFDALAVSYKASLDAPLGTVMVFYNLAPPLGWVQTTNDDRMLRVVNTTASGGTEGGTVSPISLDLAHHHSTSNWTLTRDQMPNHFHQTVYTPGVNTLNGLSPINSIANNLVSSHQDAYNLVAGLGVANVGRSSADGQGQPHNHGDTGKSGVAWTPKYSNVIMATRVDP